MTFAGPWCYPVRLEKLVKFAGNLMLTNAEGRPWIGAEGEGISALAFGWTAGLIAGMKMGGVRFSKQLRTCSCPGNNTPRSRT